MKVYTTLLFFFIFLMLQGCIGSAMMGTAVIATKIATDPRTIGTQVDDITLKSRVTHILTKKFNFKKQARIINVIYQGKVLLIGQTTITEISEFAEKTIINIKGVQKVYNEIRVSQPISLSQIMIDTWITTKILFKLLISDVVQFSNIKIITENGDVFLIGLVSEKEGRKAAKIASKIMGVKCVNTVFDSFK